MTYLDEVLYIIAFSLFIYGLMGLTGPKTAVRGNWIAAVGMGIAVVATLIKVRDTATINWMLIIAGLAIGFILCQSMRRGARAGAAQTKASKGE